jgi:hypothetical protein
MCEVKMSKDYGKMISDVASEIADKLEGDSLYRAFCATPIDTAKWSDYIRTNVGQLVADILMEETKETTRQQGKRLSTAREFTINKMGDEVYGHLANLESRRLLSFILDTMIAYFHNKPLPKKIHTCGPLKIY